VIEGAGEGLDTVRSFSSYSLPEAVENLHLIGLPLQAIGNNLNNLLTGGMSLEGLGGDDTLIGLGKLDGGMGHDVLKGGSGTMYVSLIRERYVTWWRRGRRLHHSLRGRSRHD
jgi:Ca2+-binding RTX toxin-like protein